MIAERFRFATRQALQLVAGLTVTSGARYGLRRGPVTVLDLGTWQANHNIAHLAQIEARRA